MILHKRPHTRQPLVVTTCGDKHNRTFGSEFRIFIQPSKFQHARDAARRFRAGGKSRNHGGSIVGCMQHYPLLFELRISALDLANDVSGFDLLPRHFAKNSSLELRPPGRIDSVVLLIKPGQHCANFCCVSFGYPEPRHRHRNSAEFGLSLTAHRGIRLNKQQYLRAQPGSVEPLSP